MGEEFEELVWGGRSDGAEAFFGHWPHRASGAERCNAQRAGVFTYLPGRLAPDKAGAGQSEQATAGRGFSRGSASADPAAGATAGG